MNGDGLVDVLEVTRSVGSGFSGTDVQITLGGSGVRVEAGEEFDFTAITAVNPVPKELLDPRHRATLGWIEEALFGRVCTIPDPSLAWLLDPAKRLTWIQGPPAMPDHYAIRLPARRVARAIKEAYVPVEKVDLAGEAWLFYAGGVHGYPPAEEGPVELARQGDRVLLGTAHGVILTNPKRSRHAWIYVHAGNLGVKLRFPSIGSARLDGDTAIIRLIGYRLHPDDSPAERKATKSRQVRVNLKTGAISNNMSAAPQTRSSLGKLVANHPWLLVGGAVFMVGALFLGLGLLAWLQIGGLDDRFQQHARTVQGSVLTKTITSSSSGGILRRQSSSPNYYVTYRFSTPEGKEVEGSAGVYSETWDNLAEGGPIQITYLPDAPRTNRVEGRTDLGSAAARLLMGGLLAVGGGALVFWDLRRFLRKTKR